LNLRDTLMGGWAKQGCAGPPLAQVGRRILAWPTLQNLSNARRLSDTVLIALYLFALSVPAVGVLLGWVEPKSLARENRPPAPMPAFSIQKASIQRFPARFEDYFQDRLPARDGLLDWHARLKVDWLDSPSTEKVILGRDGWLFMNEEKSECQGRAVSPQEQCRLWAQAFRQRRDWLARRGIEYVVVLTPEKHSVYPEYLPDVCRHSHVLSAAELLAEELRADPEMNVLALRDVLKEERGHRSFAVSENVRCLLFFRTDTHWNDEGAYVSYCALVERLAMRWPEMRPLERDRFERQRIDSFTGDLCWILHLPGDRRETTELWHLREPRAVRLPEELPLDPRRHFPKHIPPQTWGCQDSRQPRAVLFHDSFAGRLWLPVLAEHFNRLGYAPTAGFDPKTVEAIQPQVVIQEIVERKINWHAPEMIGR